ncbi:extracellular solute-binding protein [Crossiella sp. S99.2]|uniref:ABC transporter substrate-binding protein n=1 Tax=unclassified Crossiella TaxID=2620835 RepID=UPI0035AB8451
MRHLLPRSLALGLAVSAVAALTACGAGAGSDGKLELTIATFTEFGYEDLLKEYEAVHPNIRVTHRKTGQAAPHHQNLYTKLGAGSGLADVEAVEEGHRAKVMERADKFANLREIGPAEVTPDRWLGWKSEAVTTKDGRLIGYGTDIGPLAMCYRKDFFAEAGLPSDPQGVKALFATWDSFFAAGEKFTGKISGKAWFDSAAQIFNAMQNQLPQGYFNTEDKLIIESNQAIKANWDKLTAAVAKGQSAKLTAFGPEWNSAFRTGAFATKTCPSWMLGVVEQHAGPENQGKWAVTDAFPEGGGNWGGSYLTVPKQSKHPKEAAELAAWLTAPAQQLKAFAAKGTFPSQVEALSSEQLLNSHNKYFDVKAGALFAEQARKVAKAQYKGPSDGELQDVVSVAALQKVEQGASPAEGWRQLVDGAKKLAK